MTALITMAIEGRAAQDAWAAAHGLEPAATGRTCIAPLLGERCGVYRESQNFDCVCRSAEMFPVADHVRLWVSRRTGLVWTSEVYDTSVSEREHAAFRLFVHGLGLHAQTLPGAWNSSMTLTAVTRRPVTLEPARSWHVAKAAEPGVAGRLLDRVRARGTEVKDQRAAAFDCARHPGSTVSLAWDGEHADVVRVLASCGCDMAAILNP